MERDNEMHGARTAMNKVPEIREWVEQFLKAKHRGLNNTMSDEEFENFWKYHRPEIMHAEATEGIEAFKRRQG